MDAPDAPDGAVLALGVALTALAVFNYASAVYGGAMFAGIGAVLTFAFVLVG